MPQQNSRQPGALQLHTKQLSHLVARLDSTTLLICHCFCTSSFDTGNTQQTAAPVVQRSMQSATQLCIYALSAVRLQPNIRCAALWSNCKFSGAKWKAPMFSTVIFDSGWKISTSVLQASNLNFFPNCKTCIKAEAVNLSVFVENTHNLAIFETTYVFTYSLSRMYNRNQFMKTLQFDVTMVMMPFRMRFQ